MSWGETFWRFLSWRTRLNRMQFAVGYLTLSLAGAVMMQLVMFTIAYFAGGIEQVFNHPEWAAPAFLLVVPLLFGLIAGRAHDLGWPAWPIILLYLLPWPAWAVVMDGALALFGGVVASAVGDRIPSSILFASTFIPVVLIFIVLIVLVAAPGQRRANRFGEPLAAGLWNDLPSSRM